MRQFKYIGNIPSEELNNGIVHACINEDGFRCILIKNAVEKTVLSTYETDNLSIRMNTVLSFEDNNYYFHVVTAKMNDAAANSSFEMIYDYVFKKIQNPILDTELAELILSIEEFFRITPERNNRQLQIGVWGELFCVLYMFRQGYEDIIRKYHNNFYLKHDVEFSEKLRLEIKTTIDQNRIHRFRHDQLCRKDVEVIVASLVLEEAQIGLSLFSLFCEVLDLVEDVEDRFALQKLMKLCGVSEEKQGLSFSENKAEQDIRFYMAESLPMIIADIPKGVTKLEYNVDCDLGNPMPLETVIELIDNSEEE